MIEAQFEKLNLFEKLKIISNPQLCTKIEFRREIVIKNNKKNVLEFRYVLYRINDFLVEAKFIEHVANQNPIDIYCVDKDRVRVMYNEYWKNIQDKYSNKKSYEIWINDNTVVIKIKKKTYLTHEVVEDILQDRKKYQQGVYMGIILDVRDAKKIDKKAIRTLTEEKYFELTICVAIIIKSYFQKLLFDAYKKMLQAKSYHPPTYMCYNMHDALNWVKQFNKPSNVVEGKDIEKVKVTLEQGIIIIKYLEKYISEEAVDDGIRIRIEISEGKHYPVLVDTTESRGSTPEAMKRGQTGNAFDLVSAGAFLIKNPYTKLSFRVYKNIKQFPVPIKAFMTKGNAIKFLKNYI